MSPSGRSIAFLAVGAVPEAMHRGIPVPKALSIVDYDDIEITRELPIIRPASSDPELR